ncbi:MAG: chemotaxis response regulator protein-glutamate methylesterase [Acidobacteriaceae bacterium]|nr:chemotaxis response regulator protein-glutamate methylesterase [Acidobacteriaceae bacterium]
MANPSPSNGKLQPSEKIRVLVVDDSAVIRRLVTKALEEDPDLSVVGSAANGVIALQRIARLAPHVVALDVEMPEMDGLETLRRIRKEFPNTRVLMFSTLTTRGAAATLEALISGADDYFTKTSNIDPIHASHTSLRDQLIPRIKGLFKSLAEGSSAPVPAKANTVGPGRSVVVPSNRTERQIPKVIAIGVSTGGPSALASIIGQFPGDFPLPILIVQHMPPLFTRLLAERLQERCQLEIREAVAGEPLTAGRILIAPGDFHMKVVKNGTTPAILLDQTVPENSCRPAVDALFASLEKVYGGAVLAAVLTGMGRDGCAGAKVLKLSGAQILAQDEKTCVVYGMPRSIVEAGLADCVLPLQDIVPEILRQVRGSNFSSFRQPIGFHHGDSTKLNANSAR